MYHLYKHHLDISITQEKVASLMGKTMEEIGNILFPSINEEKRNQIIDDFSEEEVNYLNEHGTILYEGIEETLEILSKKYDLYIVSNCQKGYVEAFLHTHHLEKYFKDIEMSGRTGKDKGHNILLLMERNHIQEVVYIGDTKETKRLQDLQVFLLSLLAMDLVMHGIQIKLLNRLKN